MKKDVKNILEKLVECNTVKDAENTKIMNYIESELNSLGFKTLKKDKILIMGNREEVALGFVGHTDTVEYTNEWKYNPIELTQVGNKLYGLGVCDMKSGIAAIISAISNIEMSKLKKGMKLYFTYDEEIGFSGIKDVVENENNFPKTILVGEPTNNEIKLGSKGLLEFDVAFKGVKVHSSTPDKGKNAIMLAVNFINELTKFYNEEILNIKNINFRVPYTTMNIGKIEGGTEINSVPDVCRILIDFRTIDATIENKIIDKINELTVKYDAKTEILNKISAFINKTQFSSEIKTCDFITEASFLENERIILGAGPVTAHEINEYITIESLEKLVKQYQEIIEELCM